MSSVLNLVDRGSRIKASRLSRRMTLEEVVSRTDFTVSRLSKVENDQLGPSLEGLVRLAYGDDPIVLAASDSVYFDASMPHLLTSAGRGSAQVLSILFEPRRVGEAARNGHHPGPRSNGRARTSRPTATRA